MKSFLTVLKFEINHYLKNKVFIIATLLLVILIGGGLTIPTIMDQFDKDQPDIETPQDKGVTYGLYDPDGIIKDLEFLNENFYLGDLVIYTNIDTMKSDVQAGKINSAYIMNTDIDFNYIVLNNEMSDNGSNAFTRAYTNYYQKEAFEAEGISFEEVQSIIYPPLTYEVDILGKDSAGNYMYTYILVFGLYFMIIMYGQLIATAVASEKSNRTMELLVTSTKTSYLIFGKVLGGAFAGLMQFALVLGVGKLSYYLNADAWDGGLDFIFDIPVNVLLQFSIFGILGYLFFAFIFGALGALVSKTEDVNASATPVTLIFVVVFMISIMGMQNTESIVLKIASYIPFSSFMAMFVRLSMGTVAWYEVTISLVILAVSTYFVGWFSAKIYRMGTLMYGNPVKLKDIPKIMKTQ